MSFNPDIYGGYAGVDPAVVINRALDLGVTMLDSASRTVGGRGPDSVAVDTPAAG
jgi:hypothetical protein